MKTNILNPVLRLARNRNRYCLQPKAATGDPWYIQFKVQVYYLTGIRQRTVLLFKTTLPALLVSVHLHHLRVDCWIHYDPSSSPQLSIRREVDKHWLFVFSQCVDNVGAILQHTLIHVLHSCKDRRR